ncbi:BZ3500_MvSof-1268-A1-R1_Chr6-3g08655 [Microbotryum saponariae]|uniref:BZ3500_MvSof-1268-A1-R1_Chr6-3g08655 protein n=1 Tax=Microbotryum saponariae TaxID=289078 RepID=A0A2X0NM94_9BASI|nr:BZ3500_MvSof-1268-A1-R1_Chr6-3g08655 [Microbotryum saponariae]SDA07256.1 BZ3501_MvSof-1269-A2-R1_Chr6-2g08358 [Microbotryum saponariae]
MRGARGAFFPRGCLLLVAFSSLALHCGPDFSASCTLTYRKALLPRSHRFCDSGAPGSSRRRFSLPFWQTLLSKIAFKALDTVRHVHPCTPAFTRPHYRGRGEERKICSWSRIDYILVQCSWANRFDFISRLNPMVFDDQDFVASIPGVVDEVYRRLEGTAPLGDVYDAALRAVAVAGHARYRSTRADMRRLRAESQSVMEALEARGEHMNEAERDAYALAKSRLDQLAVKEAQWLRIRAHVPSVDSREGQSASIRTRLNRRSRQTSIVSLEDVDGTETVDMQEALGIASRHAQSLFTPDPARGDPTNARRSLLDPIRAAKCYDDDRSDPTFGRRLPRQARVALDEPFTLLEVEAALKKTDSGRSPGPSGIPYELFKALPTYFAPKLLDLFNSIWEGGKMTASLAEGLVRLLPKNKPGANLKSLGAYRPITLRETTYKVLSKVLVARLNGVLGELLPPAQHGFMPSRRSADAGSHLTLLLEKLKSLGTDVFPEGALLSLDQQSAYDRVDHAWIFEVFEAFGFGERFISLLRALYDPETLGVRYLVNGFPTDLVRLLCGLGQGDPLSCPVWKITFQPFLDALGGPRAQLTHLAFADDAVVVVESPAALSKLQTLSQTWYEATNGKTNTDKTLVLPLGPNWLRDETAQALPTVQEGESFKWCGYAFFRHGDSKLFWTHVLDRIKAKARTARDRTLSPSGKVFYANAHIISTVLHVLSFDIPPQWFIKAAETALTDFVWGGAGRNTVARDFVFQAREDGGLGKRFWRWLHDRFASAVEQDTHWRLMYDVTPTRKRQHTQGHASSPTCLFCGNDAAVIETVSHYFFECAYSTSFWGGVLRILLDKLGIEDTDVDPSTFTPEQLTMGLPLLRGRGRTTSKWMWVRLACAIGIQRLHLLRWRVHQRFELDNVVASPSLPSALRAFERDFLSRAGFVPGARDWERFSFLDGSASRVDRRCVGGFSCVGFRRIHRSFALVKIYGMDREERSLVFLPALETQPREDIRRCRGDE